MPRKRLSMKKVKEVLRLKWDLGLSNREVARALGIATGTVTDYTLRARAADLSWPEVEQMRPEELESRLFAGAGSKGRQWPEPNWKQVHKELRRKGVTLSLLWQEYQREHPEGYQYSWFCEQYARWKKHHDLHMRQHHPAGKRLFVDFSGLKVPVWWASRDEVLFEAEVFVACLGASDLIFCCAVKSQRLEDWIEAHRRAFEFYGGVPEIVVPDNLKSGVKAPCRYDPEVNRTYWDLARHYQVAVMPGRSNKPRDKAKAEQAVQATQRWVLAPLRDERFTSLGAINAAFLPRLTKLNDRPMKVLGISRRALFGEIEKAVLRPLPSQPFELAEWLTYKVGPDYHLEVDRHYYSVPYTLVGKKLQIRLAARTVEIFDPHDERVASHARSFKRGGYTTLAEHMPPQHRGHAAWTPERITRWVSQSGPAARELAEKILSSRPHPEQGFRACLGLIRLAKRYGHDRLEAACRRALAAGTTSYRSVSSILSSGLDRQPLQGEPERRVVEHGNVRGADYYRKQVTRC